MVCFDLPHGRNVALCTGDISYNVPGLFIHTELVIKLIQMIEKKFDYRLPIRYIYGAPLVRWNGGRLLLNKHIRPFQPDDVEKEIRSAKQYGMIPLITFSNLLLDIDDIHDRDCNCLLDIIRYYEGEVIIASDCLYEYISGKYPEIPIHASVIMTAQQETRDKNYYDLLSQKYAHYVVHPDDNFDRKLLNSIKKENAEILVNERCVFACPLRKRHYESISEEQFREVEGEKVHFSFLDSCSFIPEYKQYYTSRRNVSLSVAEVRDLARDGFTCFKIQGREGDLPIYFFDLMRYMLEESIAFPTSYITFMQYLKHYRGSLL